MKWLSVGVTADETGAMVRMTGTSRNLISVLWIEHLRIVPQGRESAKL
jgi:hypothetical protein